MEIVKALLIFYAFIVCSLIPFTLIYSEKWMEYRYEIATPLRVKGCHDDINLLGATLLWLVNFLLNPFGYVLFFLHWIFTTNPKKWKVWWGK